MKEEIITFTTAKLAKEKGFITDVEGMSWIGTCYNKEGRLDDDFFDENGKELNTYFKYLAPTQSLLQRWLREKYNLFIQSKQLSLSDTEFIIVNNTGKVLSPAKIYMYYNGILGGLEEELQKALTLIKI
jgi:hypothetical protein